MTAIASIVERFSMTIEEPADDHSEWFLDWVLRSPKNASKHLTAGWLALNSLEDVYTGHDDITTAQEFFGGMGAQALMVDRLFALEDHVVQEFSWDAVNHLERVLPAHRFHVRHADAYDAASSDWAQLADGPDLVMLDFGDLTAWKTREGEKHRALLDRVFSRQPHAVVVTDIACRYLHLHRERYESLLGAGRCGSYEDYLAALLDRFEALYDYRLVEGWWDRWSAVMALVPSEFAPKTGHLRPTPDRPVGLELL